MASLFDPVHIGDLVLPNRVILSPLSRRRADIDGRPTALTAEYYAQRASAGLILTEGVAVAPPGVGFLGSAGLWSEGQVEAWSEVTRAIKRAGGRTFAQLWHIGRAVDPHHPDAAPSRAALAPIRLADGGWLSASGELEAKRVLQDFAAACRNARAAGFDGVEIHAAKGYLGDQLRGGVNPPAEGYSGAPADRIRLALQVVDAAIGVWGPGRVGVHLDAEAASAGPHSVQAILDLYGL